MMTQMYFIISIFVYCESVTHLVTDGRTNFLADSPHVNAYALKEEKRNTGHSHYGGQVFGTRAT